MTIRQYPVTWSGFLGAPGVSYFYTSTAVDASGQLSPFFDAIKTYFAVNVLWTFPGLYRELDEASGKLIDIVQGAPAGTVAGTAPSAYAPSQGVQVRWNTSGFPHGRRVVGRTYLVPTVVTQYGTDGLASAIMCNTINAAADALRSRLGGEQKVWHRPILQKNPDPDLDPIVKRPGSAWSVVSTVCPRKPVTLNARRDN